MEFTANQIAELVEGRVLGNPEVVVSYISKIEEGKKGTLTFLGNSKYESYLEDTQASVVLISEALVPKETENLPTLIVVDDAHLSFNKLLNFYNQFKQHKAGIEQPAHISETAILGENLYIGAFSYIEEGTKIGSGTKIYPNSFIGKDVTIGENCIIGPGVKIYHEIKIGNNCVIKAGSVIGSDGFGYQPTPNGYEKIPQLGIVILEDNVEIGANCTIDRATLGATLIKKGVKLDNLIHVAHNVEIGEHTVIAAQTGVAGSVKIGKWNMIGGQVGFSGHLKTGDKVSIQAQSGIISNPKDGEALYGSPAIKAMDYKKSYIYFKNLPEIVKRLENLEKNKEK